MSYKVQVSFDGYCEGKSSLKYFHAVREFEYPRIPVVGDHIQINTEGDMFKVEYVDLPFDPSCLPCVRTEPFTGIGDNPQEVFDAYRREGYKIYDFRAESEQL